MGSRANLISGVLQDIDVRETKHIPSFGLTTMTTMLVTNNMLQFIFNAKQYSIKKIPFTFIYKEIGRWCVANRLTLICQVLRF